jgi:sortase A
MSKFLRILERMSLLAGTMLLAASALAWFDGAVHSYSAIEDFERFEDLVASPAVQEGWSEQRRTEYRRARSAASGATLAILRIASTGIEVAVFDSTSKTNLNRGSGHVSDTALPGTEGNIAIAGHRDGYFRSLKDIAIGAEIELVSPRRKQKFRVSELLIVDPLDVSVLDSAEETVLTLITCYPFYFIGPAPERFVVRATLLGPSA